MPELFVSRENGKRKSENTEISQKCLHKFHFTVSSSWSSPNSTFSYLFHMLAKFPASPKSRCGRLFPLLTPVGVPFMRCPQPTGVLRLTHSSIATVWDYSGIANHGTPR
ncbi:hypothetical protein SLE2022_363600 [Rubroshorea leprosula]